MVQGTPIALSSKTDLFVGGTRFSNGLAVGGGGGKESGEAKGWWCGMGVFLYSEKGLKGLAVLINQLVLRFFYFCLLCY